MFPKGCLGYGYESFPGLPGAPLAACTQGLKPRGLRYKLNHGVGKRFGPAKGKRHVKMAPNGFFLCFRFHCNSGEEGVVPDFNCERKQGESPQGYRQADPYLDEGD